MYTCICIDGFVCIYMCLHINSYICIHTYIYIYIYMGLVWFGFMAYQPF